MLVKVNHSGVCSGHAFTKGVPVELPDNVLSALGEGNYEAVATSEKQQSPAEDKMVKKPKQK